jgi:hypothetical protein
MFNFSAMKYCIIVSEESVQEIVNILLPGREGAPNGSSFAVTSSAPQGFRVIYMTDASYKTYMSSIADEAAKGIRHKLS